MTRDERNELIDKLIETITASEDAAFTFEHALRFGRLGYETLPDEQLTKSAIAWALIEAPKKVVTL